MKAVLLAAAACLAGPAAAQTVAITNARIVVGDGSEPQAGATVVVRDGRIVAAGPGVAVPTGVRVVDAGGRYVTPGIVSGFSRLGLVEVDGVAQVNDTQARGGPFSAAIDIAPAIRTDPERFPWNRRMGVTRAIVAPVAVKNIFAGQGAVIGLGATGATVMRTRAFQLVEMGEDGAAQAGGSRASAYALFKNALREARDLSRGGRAKPSIEGSAGGRAPGSAANQRNLPLEDLPSQNAFLDTPTQRAQDVLLTRFDAAALVPVLTGQQILMVHVESAPDIVQVLALKREFPALRLVLAGASEGWRVAREIAAAQVPVIASSYVNLPAAFEMVASTHSNPGRMAAAGVKVSLGEVDSSQTGQDFRMPQYAGDLVALTRVKGATGMPYGQALATITSRPAEALGLGGEIGSLLPGRRGDVVIWDGDPLDSRSAPTGVYIDGIEQPMTTRQDRLRDRYRDLTAGALPKAYSR